MGISVCTGSNWTPGDEKCDPGVWILELLIARQAVRDVEVGILNLSA